MNRRNVNLLFKFLASSLLCCLFLALPIESYADGDPFRDHVAPILQKRCLSCHNEVDRSGDFSLQTAASATSGGYIEPNDASASHLVDIITPVDGRAEMPKDADPLTADEIETIRKWIDGGAHWPTDLVLKTHAVQDFDWWSYRPIRRPPVPAIKDVWVRTPIDAFILQTLRAKQLTHADEADRRTLIRRLTYDLIGLPPTPEEVDAFVNDRDPSAYENLVDRLLASDHYGERWARHWLDVVKYADTCGYDKDKLRPNAWPYRDYVIRAFNEDKPYSRFVQEQIAGDVLFPGDPNGILGLGFIAAGPWDFIGHVEVAEAKTDGKVARNLDRDDMVSNTINTFCSVTVQCARCHNHKFDPITQEHYYGLQAIFAALDRADRPYDASPEIALRRSELQSQIASHRKRLTELDAAVAAAGGEELQELVQRVAELRTKSQSRVLPAEHGYHSEIAGSTDTQKWVQVDLGREVALQRIVLRPCYDDFGGIGAGFGFPIQFRIEASNVDTFGESVILASEVEDFPNPGLTEYVIEGPVSARYLRVVATKLALRTVGYIFSLSELEAFDADGNNLAAGATVTALDSIDVPPRWRRENLVDGKHPIDGDPASRAALAKAEAELAAMRAKSTSVEVQAARARASEKLTLAERELGGLPASQMVYAAATDFNAAGNFRPTNGRLRPIHVLNRGDVQSPGKPAVPGVLPLHESSSWQIDSGMTESERRAALARWLTNEDHPLVWRSIVNRIWQYHFGQGIVATPNDFGQMGIPPTHPDLLDWLACEFRDGGQSFKALHRLIVTSSVYRQSSRYNGANAAIDGSNRALWRMNRRRLTAEEIRDSILAVSGALDPTMGGPGYYLFALEKTDHSPHYEYHKFDPADPASHRRSIYRFIVRSQPNPWMTTLDCADSSQSTPKRDETLTSLQALALLNNKFNLEMAQQFAESLQRHSGSVTEQVERAMLLVSHRPLGESERDELVAYAETHGLPNLCRFLFNLSEFIYLD